MRGLTLRLALAASLALLAACEDPPKPAASAKPPPAPAQPGSAGPAEAVPDGGLAVAGDGGLELTDGGSAALVGEYVYSPVAKRDPFRSFLDDAAVKVVDTSASSSRCGPICQWEIDQLKLVAVVSGVASPLAMVEDPDGRGYLIRRGAFIGKRSGKVSDIRRDTVVVTELIRRRDGALIPAKTEILLRERRKAGARVRDDMVDLSTPEGKSQ